MTSLKREAIQVNINWTFRRYSLEKAILVSWKCVGPRSFTTVSSHRIGEVGRSSKQQ